jgi:hypothetical protein
MLLYKIDGRTVAVIVLQVEANVAMSLNYWNVGRLVV